jgi:hypothetical protein
MPPCFLLNVTIINPEDDEELALTLEGKKKKIKREHFDRLGEGFGLTPKKLIKNCWKIDSQEYIVPIHLRFRIIPNQHSSL